jgi:outer membrane receptor protein involved in Fe transport
MLHENRFALVLASALLVNAQPQEPAADSIEELQKMMHVEVRTATMEKQRLQDAPASVTVLTSADIQRYGFRTLGEVLSNVRSFYPTTDGVLHYIGVRGFSLLGDYNTRFLVMINGHPLTDNVYSAMYLFGEDFPLDMDLVDQIEIVRGPSSALYGSNGLFATVNIITKTPTSSAKSRISTEIGSGGGQKASVSVAFPAGREARVLLSASGLREGGRTVEFPELAALGAPSRADHVESEKAVNVFANVMWKDWTFTALWGEDKALAPAGWFGADIGSTDTWDLESRSFVEAAWHRPVGKNDELEWRLYYDQYRYDGVYDYRAQASYINLDGALGDWVGSGVTYHHRTNPHGTLTLGGQVNVDLRNTQYNYSLLETDAGRVREDTFRISHPRTSYGLFAQQQLQLSSSWTAYIGARVDDTTADSPFVSPRLALIYTRRRAAYKLMYGRAFRDPSTFERYWEPNPALTAERMNTFEFSREQNLFKRINLVTSAYYYRLSGLIEGVPISESLLQYQNVSRTSAAGAEVEVNGNPTDWLDTTVSLSMESAKGGSHGARLQNSPVRLAQFRASAPVGRQWLRLGGAVRYVSSRMGAYNDRTPGVAMADLTLNALRVRSGLDLQFGVRNLLNTRYSDPLSIEHTPHRLPLSGRTLFVKVTRRSE